MSDHVIGIDLGTSNCALAYARVTAGAPARIEDFAIPQLLRPGQVASQALLPSALYLPGEHEMAAGALALPWDTAPPYPVGEFARWQGGRVPGRLVASAKSWLSHAGVDRTAPILPWGAPPDVAKVSPTRASSLYLQHLAAAWDHAHPGAPLARQEVVITVPASFDEVARALTVTAARDAGLETFTLVEEPQAAFYAYTAEHEHTLAEALRGIRLVLVVDVGGGTTDFTLIQVAVGDDGPVLKRVAVGDHLLLGGDNMDAALARHAEEKLRESGHKVSPTQWSQLVQAARVAKETLLREEAPDGHILAVAGAGSRLVGSTLSTTVSRAEVERLVVEGFFPACDPAETPRRAPRVALQELGLPYVQDTGITRHLVAFLRRHAQAGAAALGGQAAADETIPLPRPDALLLNGGVFNSPRLADRLVDVLSSWWPQAARIPLLRHASLDLAVARGAARYALVRRGLGRRIGGGAAQAFYVGLGGADNDAGRQAVCVIPRGHEEGIAIDITHRPFRLALGQPVQFPLYSSAADRVDLPGEIVRIDDSFHPLPPLHTLFKATVETARRETVHLRSSLTELGTLELWCVANTGEERWRLEFELRGQAGRPAEVSVTEAMPAGFDAVRTVVERVYGPASQQVDPKQVKQLGSALEEALGPRETWRLPLLRELWGTLFAGAGRRRRSTAHERTFFRLVGYSLRPGVGYPLDAWRCEQTFRLFGELIHAQSEQSVWNEFWICWRRVAGGLREEHHEAIWAFLKPHLARRVPLHPPKHAARPKGIQPEGVDEMIRTAASLEHLPAAEKGVFGDWIIERLRHPSKAGPGPWAWALGRVGTRAPLYGSGHRTLPAEQAAAWLEVLLDQGLRAADGAPFAATQLARMTGDRTRDLDPELRTRTAAALREVDAPERWVQMVESVVTLEAADEARALGDTLPLGLQLR